MNHENSGEDQKAKQFDPFSLSAFELASCAGSIISKLDLASSWYSSLPMCRAKFCRDTFLSEFTTFLRFIGGQNNLYCSSLCPGLYRSIVKMTSPRSLALYDCVIAKTHRLGTNLPANSGLSDHERLILEGIRITPSREKWFLHDSYRPQLDDWIYLSNDSLFFAEYLNSLRKKYNYALDLCSGAGILAITLSKFCTMVLGIELNTRATLAAKANSLLNAVENVEFRCEDVFSYATDQEFDLVVANPPFIAKHICTRKDSDGGARGYELSLRLLTRVRTELAPNADVHFLVYLDSKWRVDFERQVRTLGLEVKRYGSVSNLDRCIVVRC